MLKKLLGIAAIALLATVTMASTASAQDSSSTSSSTTVSPYPPKTNSIVLSLTRAPRRAAVTATARTYRAGVTVSFRFLSTPVALGTAVADANGVATLNFNVPADATLDLHHVESTGIGSDGQTLTQTAAITVIDGSSGTVPRTGANSTKPMAEIGVGALALGGLFLLISRRRSRAHAAA
jgi:LPXTG-motif cell wall-anchored protein